jgi:hypothetical protein
MTTFTPREQPTKPCEVCITTTDGRDIQQRDCGKLARVEVNGFPMCASCFAGYEGEELVESVALIADQAPSSVPTKSTAFARG